MVFDEKEEKQDKEEILRVLEHKLDITEVSTNGYWFKFNYNGREVSFVNQDGRFCVDTYIPIEDKITEADFKKIIRDKDITGNFENAINTLQVENYTIDGPTCTTIRTLCNNLKNGQTRGVSFNANEYWIEREREYFVEKLRKEREDLKIAEKQAKFDKLDDDYSKLSRKERLGFIIKQIL